MSAKIIEFRPQGDHEWAQWAECAKPGAPSMFPNPQDDAGTLAAKQTCLGCPARFECLTAALKRGEQHGVWGGLTTAERAALRRQRDVAKGQPRLTPEELADKAMSLDGAA